MLTRVLRNSRRLRPSRHWDTIRTQVFQRSTHKCWNCGTSQDLLCHEVFSDDNELLGFLCVCKTCHHTVEQNSDKIPKEDIILLTTLQLDLTTPLKPKRPKLLHRKVGPCDLCGRINKLLPHHWYENYRRNTKYICHTCNTLLGYLFRESAYPSWTKQMDAVNSVKPKECRICGFIWKPRVPKPKQCPRCKNLLKSHRPLNK